MSDANQQIADAIKLLIAEHDAWVRVELDCDPATLGAHVHGFKAALLEVAARLHVRPGDSSLEEADIDVELARRSAMSQEQAQAEGRIQFAWDSWSSMHNGLRARIDARRMN